MSHDVGRITGARLWFMSEGIHHSQLVYMGLILYWVGGRGGICTSHRHIHPHLHSLFMQKSINHAWVLIFGYTLRISPVTAPMIWLLFWDCVNSNLTRDAEEKIICIVKAVPDPERPTLQPLFLVYFNNMSIFIICLDCEHFTQSCFEHTQHIVTYSPNKSHLK